MFGLVNSFADSDYAGTRRTSLAASFFAFIVCYSGLEISNQTGSSSGIFSSNDFLIKTYWLYFPLLAISFYALLRNAAQLPDQKYLTIQEGKRTEETLKQLSGWEREAKSLQTQIAKLIDEIPSLRNEVETLLDTDLGPDSTLYRRLLVADPNVQEVAEFLEDLSVAEEFRVSQLRYRRLLVENSELKKSLAEIGKIFEKKTKDIEQVSSDVTDIISLYNRGEYDRATGTPWETETLEIIQRLRKRIQDASQIISQFEDKTTSLSQRLAQTLSSIETTYGKAEAVQKSQVIQEISEEISNALRAQNRSILFNVYLPFAVTVILFAGAAIYCAFDFFL